MSARAPSDAFSPAMPPMFPAIYQENDKNSFWDPDAERSVLEDLVKDFPQSPAPDFCTDKLTHMPEGSKDAGWQHCHKAVERHDADLCQAYREQIDTLLVFAGLFSAVVTAFAVESYQWLLDDPADASAELLRDVVHLLAQSLNQTTLPARSPVARLSNSVIARINVFWFLSLTLSLSAALIGILCKQWLREFERDVGQSPETALGVRYIRYQGLSYWKVGSIVNSVPIFLQVSLALFLTGVVELLWRLNFTVAVCVTIVAGATLAFYVATTLLPLIQYMDIILRLCGWRNPDVEAYMMDKVFAEPQCAFKSAQAWIVLRAVQPVIEYVLKRYSHPFQAYRDDDSTPLILKPADSWITFDMNWMKRRDCAHWGATSVCETLAWVAENLDERNLRISIWQCVWGLWLQARSVPVGYVPPAMDLGCVARAFPEPSHLDTEIDANIRCQAAIFRCTLHTTFSVNTAVEMVLRIAPRIGVDSNWTTEALRAVHDVYRNMPVRLSNDMAVGLFRLAKLQTQAIILRQSTARDSETASIQWQGTSAFFEVFQLLHRSATESDERFLPAMCGLALQWFRAHPDGISTREPRHSNADFAADISNCMISYYAYLKCNPARLHEYPGIILPARLTAMVVKLESPFGQLVTEYWLSILETLVHIAHDNPGTVALSVSRAPPTISPVPVVAVATSASASGTRFTAAVPLPDENGGHSSSVAVQHIAIQLDAAADSPQDNRTSVEP